MNNDSKEPLKGKELRDLARSEPGQALIYLDILGRNFFGINHHKF